MKKILMSYLSAIAVFTQVSAQSVAFTSITQRIPFITGTMGQAKCAADMNGDGLDDVSRIGPDGIHFDYQQEDGSFQHLFVPQSIQVLPIWSVCAGDLDNNGYNDFLFAGGQNVSFLLANNQGTGYAETKMPDFIYCQRSTLFDIDQDGDLDAFVCNDDGKSQVFRNDGFGKMSLDQGLINTSNLPGNYSAIWTDYNNDGLTDLYITKCLANALPGNPARTNLLYRNNGNGTFTENGASAGLDDNAQSWSTVFEDFDNDGDFDAFIVNHDQGNRLFKNNGDGTFTNVIAASGIDETDLGAWENASGDFNNDGFVDIISELKQELYLGHGDLTFTGQNLPVTPGAIGDLNNDGFLDILYRNQLWANNGNGHHWVKVQLRGIESNRNGIGTRVEIYGPWGIQVRELRSGQSFSPMNTLTLHFGLGAYDHIEKMLLKWPSGTLTELTELRTDTTYTIVEASCLLPTQEPSIFGKMALCPGDSVVMLAPPGFTDYLWSDGTQGQRLASYSAGRFQAVFSDSSGCRGFTRPIEVALADAHPPMITLSGGELPLCAGQSVVLTSSAGNGSDWSTGEQDTAMILVSSSGQHRVFTDSLCGTGQLASEATEITFLDAPAPLVNAATLLPGDSILLTAEGVNCAWYHTATGGNAIASGCELQTSALYADTLFYVESRYTYPGTIQYGGKIDSLGFSPAQPSNKKMHFTAWQPFTLLSTTVYLPPQAQEGIRTFRLRAGNDLLADTTAYLVKGKNLVQLGFQVSAGNYTLECDRDDQLQIAGVLDYPYPLGALGQLDSSSKGLNFYPYFFDWKIQQPDISCTSARTPVWIKVSATWDRYRHPDIGVFPVPASESLFVRPGVISNQDITALVYDCVGRQCLQQSFPPSATLELNTSLLPEGIYRLLLICSGQTAAANFLVLRNR